MLISSLRNSFVLLLVLLPICQGRAQKNESGEQQVHEKYIFVLEFCHVETFL
jgi:hypothetical protein